MRLKHWKLNKIDYKKALNTVNFIFRLKLLIRYEKPDLNASKEIIADINSENTFES